MMSMEEKIQETITNKLCNWNIYPFSVIFTFKLCDDDSGRLAITFFMTQDVEEFLKHMDYNSQCDKSGFYIIRETDTVILSGMALLNLYTNDI